MRPPTGNEISQKQHGTYKAVDYHSSPDVNIYAPEDGTVYKWLLDAGDAGNELQIQGAHGRHGFCHMEETYVQPGERVKKGQAIGKMGFTGKTAPAGPAGRHLHWVLLQHDGTYVYPPSLANEAFGTNAIKKEEKDVADYVTMHGLEVIHRFREGKPVSDYSKKNRLGKMTFDEADADVMRMMDQEHAQKVKDAQKLINSHLPANMR